MIRAIVLRYLCWQMRRSDPYLATELVHSIMDTIGKEDIERIKDGTIAQNSPSMKAMKVLCGFTRFTPWIIAGGSSNGNLWPILDFYDLPDGKAGFVKLVRQVEPDYKPVNKWPCPKCGETLRSPRAQQCFECGECWR